MRDLRPPAPVANAAASHGDIPPKVSLVRHHNFLPVTKAYSYVNHPIYYYYFISFNIRHQKLS